MTKKYTIEEIERMRECVGFLVYRSIDNRHDGVVEDHLRTYMANGTSVEELEVHVSRKTGFEMPSRPPRA